MKYFSLLSNREIHPAPGHKLIPAEEFSSLVNASEVMAEVVREGEEFKRNSLEEAEK